MHDFNAFKLQRRPAWFDLGGPLLTFDALVDSPPKGDHLASHVGLCMELILPVGRQPHMFMIVRAPVLMVPRRAPPHPRAMLQLAELIPL